MSIRSVVPSAYHRNASKFRNQEERKRERSFEGKRKKKRIYIYISTEFQKRFFGDHLESFDREDTNGLSCLELYMRWKDEEEE